MEGAKFINIGFGSVVNASRVVALVSPESAPIKRLIQDAREKEYRELLLELTEKFSIVNEINSKLDTLCTQCASQPRE